MSLQVCVETMMHLTCTNMPQTELENALDKVKLSPACAAVPLNINSPESGHSLVAAHSGAFPSGAESHVTELLSRCNQ